MTAPMYLDAPSLVYRAFFALPKTIKDPSGNPVNAVRGFMEMATRLVIDHRPDDIVAVFDDNYRPAFRVEAYPGYKADRPDDPPELPRQFSVLTEVLDAAGMIRAGSSGLEADDAIASLVEGVKGEDRAVVVTGDRDLTSLVRDPHVRLLFTVRGVSNLEIYDEQAVRERYGVSPSSYVDFAILRGDPSDGLPGVTGIGPKRAAALIAEHGSLDGILGHLDTLPSGAARSFREASDYLDAMRTVVPPVRDAPVHLTEAHEPDDDALAELAERHNLGSSAPRLAQALRGER